MTEIFGVSWEVIFIDINRVLDSKEAHVTGIPFFLTSIFYFIPKYSDNPLVVVHHLLSQIRCGLLQGFNFFIRLLHATVLKVHFE